MQGIDDIADQFVRVRLNRIDRSDINLLTFDLDTTIGIFFLNAREQILGRYGGRDSRSAEAYVSLEGLHYSMRAALETDRRQNEGQQLVSTARQEPRVLSNVAVSGGGRCPHCHNVKEHLDRELREAGAWTRESIYRYPSPTNLGLVLDTARGNVVGSVTPGSPAESAGLRAGDFVDTLNGQLVRSFSDAQFALDGAPAEGTIPITWSRDGTTMSSRLTLVQGWRASIVTWRHSLRHVLAHLRLSGKDLKAAEKEKLGLDPKQLAFRPKNPLPRVLDEAGIQPDDIILGIDNREAPTGSLDFADFVRSYYLPGDVASLQILRDGERIDAPITVK